MSRRIYLVRHGRSAHVHRGWIDADGLLRWRAAYDAAGIVPDDAPPPAVRALAAQARVVVASDLPRAVASAERLAPGGAVGVSPLLRETDMTAPAWPPGRLPLAGWALSLGARWTYDAVRGTPAPAAHCRRAAEAAAWLEGLSDEHGTVLAVTHASFRGLLAAALRERAWRCAPGPAWQRYRHWSVWAFGARDEALPGAAGTRRTAAAHG